jgi:hypothetical protein
MLTRVPLLSAWPTVRGGWWLVYTRTFWWFNPLLVFGYEHPLVMDDLWKLARQDESAHFVAAFRRAWDSQAASLYAPPPPSTFSSIPCHFGRGTHIAVNQI